MMLPEQTWFKSSHSGSEGTACVEVALTPHTVHIRDSKRRDGPHLSIPAPAWAGFLDYASRA
ncbi:DUF397 domain-containing protein [Streptomyces sp. SCA3-4]|uniref:DUF397 domain-containing protein n=1 Tax=Streptomyces sichuanensis TaxID=2871810 RepID=UPI001CE35CB7|nr:DUF397 domain-containing protein [Streptomyces sichuanensis]MCA6094474.1 DUF397 domain-containing protein [Streptomyces sichuanensis]